MLNFLISFNNKVCRLEQLASHEEECGVRIPHFSKSFLLRCGLNNNLIKFSTYVKLPLNYANMVLPLFSEI